MTSTHLQQWIQHPETLNRDTLYELRTLVARYPYFQSIRLLYLKNLYLLHDINFGAELRKAVLYVADRRVLFYLIEGDRYTLKSRKSPLLSSDAMEEEPSVDRTLSLIDAFLATVPEEHSQNTELDYTMDYTAYLMNEDERAEPSESGSETVPEVPKLRGHELIDGFILKSETTDVPLLEAKELPSEPSASPSESPVSSANEELDDSCFTETLAKIYIKQRRYDKALEIIKKLSLNYPKKNAYFADQIRFLEKLIINAKSK
ncbi:tetratricopeptide repeat protein [Bacteroides sp. GD17]|jgi:tetratricopeptide (TPR) repeat protein|uniref:tetratricopeptide repeat protein n=1 Tax=Bacteroides sp. GD17 TaxID=3139826 RepID=UPI0025F9FCE1|nr:tetratricopeptide repeat protein [uncultured Bacteroides sp.]